MLMQVKKMKVHPEDVAVQYERLVTLSQELSELASRLGGQAGEALLDESAAKVSLRSLELCCPLGRHLMQSELHLSVLLAVCSTSAYSWEETNQSE